MGVACWALTTMGPVGQMASKVLCGGPCGTASRGQVDFLVPEYRFLCSN
jgi:hypothetical protein